MKILLDKYGRKIRLTKEREKHILSRPEMGGQENKIEETLKDPDAIRYSIRDDSMHLYYKLYAKTPVTQKDLLVAVKVSDKEGFIVTAFFTDRIKKGEIVWQRE